MSDPDPADAVPAYVSETDRDNPDSILVSEYEKFSLLCRLTSGCEIVRISSVRDFLKSIDKTMFRKFVRTLCWERSYSRRELLAYYFVLFRDDPSIRDLLRNSDFPLQFLEQVIVYPLVHARPFGSDVETVFDEMLEIVSPQSLYELATGSLRLSSINAFMYYFLSRMDNRSVDRYFEDPARVRRFIEGVCRMPEEMISSFFIRNPKLHEYYVFYINSVDMSMFPEAKSVCRIDVSEIEQVKIVAEKVNERFPLRTELGLPLPKRNKKRFEYVLSGIRSLKNKAGALIRLRDERIIDENERKLLEEILENPMFGNVLLKYSSLQNDLFTKQEVEFLF
jgi:hypothetical protein